MTTDDIDEIKSTIEQMETELRELKHKYREMKTHALREALEARRDADVVVQQEMDRLGWSSRSGRQFHLHDVTSPSRYLRY